MIVFVLGSAPMELKVPKYDKLICIGTAHYKTNLPIPDLTILESHLLGQPKKFEGMKNLKTKKVLIVNSGSVPDRKERFSTFNIQYEDYEEITTYKKQKIIEKALGKWMDITWGAIATCDELSKGNKVITSRISFTRRNDAEALKILKEKYGGNLKCQL